MIHLSFINNLDAFLENNREKCKEIAYESAIFNFPSLPTFLQRRAPNKVFMEFFCLGVRIMSPFCFISVQVEGLVGVSVEGKIIFSPEKSLFCFKAP